jgi:uncharacterized protein (DUF2384 family)
MNKTLTAIHQMSRAEGERVTRYAERETALMAYWGGRPKPREWVARPNRAVCLSGGGNRTHEYGHTH